MRAAHTEPPSPALTFGPARDFDLFGLLRLRLYAISAVSARSVAHAAARSTLHTAHKSGVETAPTADERHRRHAITATRPAPVQKFTRACLHYVLPSVSRPFCPTKVCIREFAYASLWKVYLIPVIVITRATHFNIAKLSPLFLPLGAFYF